MDYRSLLKEYPAETVIMATGVSTTSAFLMVAILTLWDPVQVRVDDAEKKLTEVEQALEASLLNNRKIEQRLADALERSEILQVAADGDEMIRLQNLLNRKNEELAGIRRRLTETEQRLTEALAVIDAAKLITVDPTVPTSWLGTWGGRYLCATGSRREGLVRWQVTKNGNDSFLIDEVAARENPEPNKYNVQLSGASISGHSTNGKYRVSATLQQDGTIQGDWPGHACGQIVLAKLF